MYFHHGVRMKGAPVYTASRNVGAVFLPGSLDPPTVVHHEYCIAHPPLNYNLISVPASTPTRSHRTLEWAPSCTSWFQVDLQFYRTWSKQFCINEHTQNQLHVCIIYTYTTNPLTNKELGWMFSISICLHPTPPQHPTPSQPTQLIWPIYMLYIYIYNMKAPPSLLLVESYILDGIY